MGMFLHPGTVDNLEYIIICCEGLTSTPYTLIVGPPMQALQTLYDMPLERQNCPSWELLTYQSNICFTWLYVFIHYFFPDLILI